MNLRNSVSPAKTGSVIKAINAVVIIFLINVCVPKVPLLLSERVIDVLLECECWSRFVSFPLKLTEFVLAHSSTTVQNKADFAPGLISRLKLAPKDNKFHAVQTSGRLSALI